MENNDTSGIIHCHIDDLIEKKGMGGLNEEEMNNLMATMEDLFNAMDWDKVKPGMYLEHGILDAKDEEEDTQQ